MIGANIYLDILNWSEFQIFTIVMQSFDRIWCALPTVLRRWKFDHNRCGAFICSNSHWHLFHHVRISIGRITNVRFDASNDWHWPLCSCRLTGLVRISNFYIKFWNRFFLKVQTKNKKENVCVFADNTGHNDLALGTLVLLHLRRSTQHSKVIFCFFSTIDNISIRNLFILTKFELDL